MQVFNVNIPIYAESENEVAELRQTIVWFINLHRANGRAVSARKVSAAIKSWDSNFLVKKKIIDHFK
jgi:hypothetical protein